MVDGNQTLVLGLIWAIIHHYQVSWQNLCSGGGGGGGWRGVELGSGTVFLPYR